ncbi:DNA-binding transcriptional regulator YhcF (GntR family) [Kineococcus xinjiangensis]|uniref:DNA-binding transcriptional regulator YhcF (GntR family) n=1 Tax=Kineococcus xinjiangensis TaxID=512762 RepID=A0A2S6ITL2_9ACTN|nr:GntR family transcriptional regulator [Kineococcus xinjiangensis]PPK97520.1 DNA-binding transcriptional regulator YhcF (GntR family) [Kineococcus xinjiangensis]
MSGDDLALVLDLDAPIPPYEQIRQQVSAHVSAGSLSAGDRLPSARALAADLGVAVGTVNRAYRELEAGGLVVSRRRTGTVVTGAPTVPDSVQRAAEELAARGRAAGLGDGALLDVLRGALLAAPAAHPVRASSPPAPAR